MRCRVARATAGDGQGRHDHAPASRNDQGFSHRKPQLRYFLMPHGESDPEYDVLIRDVFGVSDGIRTHDIQDHNLAL
jgi:hypothetical protein